jgi:cytochrome c-type protein NapB
MTRSRICIFIITMLFSVSAVGDEVESLRGANPIDSESTEPARVRYRDTEEPIARSFEQQPPLVPHALEKYAITTESNRCMSCHSWADYEEAGATRVGDSHFVDNKGGVDAKLEGRRYFCNQCHVAQADAKPLVENTFRASAGDAGSDAE